MNKTDTPAKVASNAQLGPLPEPRTLSRGDDDGAIRLGYTADQMRAYALAERERCALLCEGLREVAEHSSDGLKRAGALSMATSCAKLIRA